MTDPIEAAARRLADAVGEKFAVGEFEPGFCDEPGEFRYACLEEIQTVMLPILREVRRQALEEACAAMCEWCEAGDELFRDPSPEWDWYHVDEDSDEAFDCDAGRIRALMDPSPDQSSSGPAIVDPGANAEATGPSSKP